ncbi:hypothetical protein [Enterococcus sp. DIV0170]|uniref:hypothetical protein n=1 Tax=Enterococcus sp. DIV0170 TaxID=2774642 RepID=UPI003F1F1C19
MMQLTLLQLILEAISAETYALIILAIIFYTTYKFVSGKYRDYKNKRDAYRKYWRQRIEKSEKIKREEADRK